MCLKEYGLFTKVYKFLILESFLNSKKVDYFTSFENEIFLKSFHSKLSNEIDLNFIQNFFDFLQLLFRRK